MGNDLEIEIHAGATPGTYDVEVDSPAGTATGIMQLDAAAILGRRRELAASVLASAVTSRSTFSTLERPVRDVGHGLFEALFKDRIYGRYTASLQQAGSKGEPLRVVLRIRDPELAGIPWETLFDPEAGEYLCQREPVVRYVEAAQPSAPLTATGPLRILCMVAAPSDLPTLDTAEERRRLDNALGELVEQGLVEVVWVEGRQLERVAAEAGRGSVARPPRDRPRRRRSARWRARPRARAERHLGAGLRAAVRTVAARLSAGAAARRTQLVLVGGVRRRRPALQHSGGAGAQRDQRGGGDAVRRHRPGRAGVLARLLPGAVAQHRGRRVRPTRTDRHRRHQ